MTIILPFAVALIGLLLWALSDSPKVQEIGKICFFCGLLVTLFMVSPQTLSILR